jgi:IS1 family transposase
MNNLPRDQQIEIIAALTEGMSIRSVERITGVHRDTIMRLGARVGRGCWELHDRMMVGLRVGRIECDELWAFVGKKQKQTTRHEFTKGDQYTFVALASSAKPILSYRTGKRDGENTDLFVQDLRERVLGAPEFSTDGWSPYQNAIRDAFGNRVAHGVITKTYRVTHLAVNEASRRYSPAAVIAVSRDVVSGIPSDISTSYVERQNLSVRMSSRRFTRLTTGLARSWRTTQRPCL